MWSLLLFRKDCHPIPLAFTENPVKTLCHFGYSLEVSASLAMSQLFTHELKHLIELYLWPLFIDMLPSCSKTERGNPQTGGFLHSLTAESNSSKWGFYPLE